MYTTATLQPMQCTCSIGCSYTADTLPGLQVHCKYTAGTLLLHCKHTAGTLQLAVYTANTLQNCLLWQHFCTLHIHWQQVAVYLQCTCSLHCSYSETILPVHSTSVWDITRTDPGIHANPKYSNLDLTIPIPTWGKSPI